MIYPGLIMAAIKAALAPATNMGEKITFWCSLYYLCFKGYTTNC